LTEIGTGARRMTNGRHTPPLCWRRPIIEPKETIMTFAPGDVVALKSGGHSMTVVSVDQENIDCLWVGDAGELFRQALPAIALIMIEHSDEEEDDAEHHDAEHHDEEDEDRDGDDDDDDEDDDDDDDKKKKHKKR
jgi:uncharacterized protein YodC (DUF2158 family)